MSEIPELPNTHPGNRLINDYRKQMLKDGLSPEHYTHMVNCVNEYNTRLTVLPESERTVPYPIPDPSYIKKKPAPKPEAPKVSAPTTSSNNVDKFSGYQAFWAVVMIFLIAFWIN